MSAQRKHLRLAPSPPSIDLAPFVGEVNALLEIFDRSTPSGQALEWLGLIRPIRLALAIAAWAHAANEARNPLRHSRRAARRRHTQAARRCAMSSVHNPIDHPQDWDTVTIGNVQSPGICKLSGFKRQFGWEQKKGKGARGSTVTLNEYPAAEGSITFQLWTPEHFQQWADFRNLLKYDPIKKTVAAVEIHHPSLADIDVTSVVCKNIGAIEHQGNGLYTIDIDLIEYNPPPKAAATATPDHSTFTAKPAKPAGEPPRPTAEELLAGLEQQRREAGDPFK